MPRKIAERKGARKMAPRTAERPVAAQTVDDVDISSVVETVSGNGFEVTLESFAVGGDEFCSVHLTTSSSSEDDVDVTVVVGKTARSESKTVFDIDDVDAPLVGTPAEVKKELDDLAIRLQRRPKDHDAFLRIVCYMHKYILGLVFKKYSFVRGSDEKDIYQEALIALFKKAIPSFRKGRGMSFLNFAKMCINRHLITILNASRNRIRDKPLNTAVSLDHSPGGHDGDDDDSCPLSNVVADSEHGKLPFNDMAKSETFERTLTAIKSVLSDFEQSVLMEYLQDKSYKDASRAISKKYGRRCNERSIDNALLRIRKKAMAMKDESGEDVLPLVFSPIDGGR